MFYRKAILSAAAVAVTTAVGTIARGAFVVTLQQVGAAVIATGSGTLNTAALVNGGAVSDSAVISPTNGAIGLGPATLTPAVAEVGIAGPLAFGPGGTLFSTGTGDIIELYAPGNLIDVPAGYVSGSRLADTATFPNSTLASLGVTPGTYVWTWGSGPTADSFKVTTAVPEPAVAAAAALPVAVRLLGRRRRPGRR